MDECACVRDVCIESIAIYGMMCIAICTHTHSLLRPSYHIQVDIWPYLHTPIPTPPFVHTLCACSLHLCWISGSDPGQVLELLDSTVEIPQLGLIRSLNVHVSGAIAMYEYTKQHLARQ